MRLNYQNHPFYPRRFELWLNKYFKQIFALILMVFMNEPLIVEGLLWEKMIWQSYSVGQVPRTKEEKIIQVIVQEFMKDAALHKVEVSLWRLSFSVQRNLENKDGSSNLGVCYHARNHIIISQDSFDPQAYQELKATIYHELGHCLFGLKHESLRRDFPPLMLDGNSGWDALIKIRPELWDLAVKDLFSKAKV